MKKTLTKWHCDLCDNDVAPSNKAGLPQGWIQLSLDSTMQDRTFFEKHICAGCVETIRKELKARNITAFVPAQPVYDRT